MSLPAIRMKLADAVRYSDKPLVKEIEDFNEVEFKT
jgi:hypothetical protein